MWVRSCGGTALLLVNRIGHIEQAYGLSPVWARAALWQPNCFGAERAIIGGGVDPRVLRQLAGAPNCFSQCLQTCSVAPVTGIESASPDGTSDAQLEAVASVGPPSDCCRETRWAAPRWRGRL